MVTWLCPQPHGSISVGAPMLKLASTCLLLPVLCATLEFSIPFVECHLQGGCLVHLERECTKWHYTQAGLSHILVT